MPPRYIPEAWQPAIGWGVAVALLHRLGLMIWMAAVWLVSGIDVQVTFDGGVESLPPLTTRTDRLLFGVWRRWDTMHYFNLALNGYRASDPGPTVFGALTPLGFRLFDRLLPGGIDLAAMVFSTLAFAIALIFLFRIVETYYGDARLARWSVVVLALLPLSYFFSAPMSESIYLAMILAAFYFGTQRRWVLAAIAGALATLARSQGVLLVIIIGLFLIVDYPPHTWRQSTFAALRAGWSLALLPLVFIGFEVWRVSLGLPGLNDTYHNYSYIYVTNPIAGLATNLGWIVQHPLKTLTSIDMLALLSVFLLSFAMLRFPLHRRLPLIAYTFGYALLFAGKINYIWGTDIVINTQSYGRYALTLFPLVIFGADRLIHLTKWWRLLLVVLMFMLLLFFSGLHALGVGPA